MTAVLGRGAVRDLCKGCARYTSQVIDRVGICESDVEILQNLAARMDLDDAEQKKGCEEIIRLTDAIVESRASIDAEQPINFHKI